MEKEKQEERKLFTRELKCFLTFDEKERYTKTMIDKVAEQGNAELAKKAAAAYHTEKIQAIQVIIRDAATKLGNGYEERAVECEEIKDYDRGEINVMRLDNDEKVESRLMTQHERQMRIDEVIKNQKEADKKEKEKAGKLESLFPNGVAGTKADEDTKEKPSSDVKKQETDTPAAKKKTPEPAKVKAK